MLACIVCALLSGRSAVFVTLYMQLYLFGFDRVRFLFLHFRRISHWTHLPLVRFLPSACRAFPYCRPHREALLRVCRCLATARGDPRGACADRAIPSEASLVWPHCRARSPPFS